MIAAVSIQKFMAKIEALRLNVNMATEVLRLTAENIKDNAETKYDEFIETVASNAERFEAWRDGVGERFSSMRQQLEDMTQKQKKTSPLQRLISRLFTVSHSMENSVRTDVNELEEEWKDVNGKLDQ